MKQCTYCKEHKPLTEFCKDGSKKHGFSARCKSCKKKIHNEYRKDRGYDARRYWKDPQAERERHLLRKYGISLEKYKSMLEAQEGKCAICGREQERCFDVDHDHVTGEVRGLLCASCNRMLGHAGDDIQRLMSGAEYLSSSRKSRRK